MPTLDASSLDSLIMGSYGGSNFKLFRQNQNGTWVADADAIRMLRIVYKAVENRGAELPIKKFLNVHVAKKNASSEFLSNFDDVSDDLAKHVRGVVDKLRVLVVENYATVGDNYVNDLKPLYVTLMDSCEKLLEIARGMNRATTQTLSATSTGSSNVLALHAAQNASPPPSTGGGGSAHKSANSKGTQRVYASLDDPIDIPSHYSQNMITAFKSVDEQRERLALLVANVKRPSDFYPSRFDKKNKPCWQNLTVGNCTCATTNNISHAKFGVYPVTIMNKILADEHFFENPSALKRLAQLCSMFVDLVESNLKTKSPTYSQAARQPASQPKTTTPALSGNTSVRKGMGHDNILIPLPALSPNATSVDPDEQTCKHCVYKHKKGQQGCYCEQEASQKLAEDNKKKYPSFYVCPGPSGDATRFHFNLRVFESARHTLAWGVRCGICPASAFGSVPSAPSQQTQLNSTSLDANTHAIIENQIKDSVREIKEYCRTLSLAEAEFAQADGGTIYDPPPSN